MHPILPKLKIQSNASSKRPPEGRRCETTYDTITTWHFKYGYHSPRTFATSCLILYQIQIRRTSVN